MIVFNLAFVVFSHLVSFVHIPGRFPGTARNAGNHGKDGKFCKNGQILNQTKTIIDKLCLGKISLQKPVRIKLSVDSRFSNELYGQKRKPENAGNQHKVFYIKKHPVLTLYRSYKTAKNQSVYYLCTILALTIGKVNFKLQQ